MSNLFVKPSEPLLVPEIPSPDEEIVTCTWMMTMEVDLMTAIMLGWALWVDDSAKSSADDSVEPW